MRNNIVVLDDEPDIKKIIRIIRLALGVSPEKNIPDEEEGIQKVATLVAEHCRVDVIKLEIKIPEIDSAELLEKIKRDPQLGKLITTHAGA